MKKYLLESSNESERLNFQNKIDAYDIKKELAEFEFSPNDKVLDAGCGNGNLIDELLKLHALKIHGIDMSEDRVFKSKERFKEFANVEIFKGELEKTNLSKSYYDKICCRYIFEHVTNPIEILKALRELLVDRGNLYIVNMDQVFFGFYTKNEKFNQDLKKLQASLPQDYEIGRKLPQMLAISGYKEVNWKAETFFFHGESLALERKNTEMRLIQLRDYLSTKFDSVENYDEFASTYLDEMQDPNNVLYMSKFIIKAAA
jgi:ubiquinone/menaquinone biosynthesis C-methylase UbiE